jgi:hypothetical protein
MKKIRPIFDTLRDLRGGTVLDDLGSQLNDLVTAVQETGKGGTLSLTISVKPMASSRDAVVVTDDIVLKAPRITSAGTVMFPTVDGNLQRTHERQDELPGLSIAGRAAAEG